MGRAHGLRGEVVVHLVTDRTERLHPGAVLATDDGGELRVVASRPHQRRHVVAFAGVADRPAAERLRGRLLMAPPLDDPEALWVHELVGAEVVGLDGRHLGRVASVQANPASDLLVLDGGGLVPLTFLVRSSPGRLVVDPPPGLLD